ncbi:hypothetical protein KY361_07650, partial [Candidatus Woesearchaeota archaeon]|nr:hypothetical protein [Candidatus Woesearchaeota archaeon]
MKNRDFRAEKPQKSIELTSSEFVQDGKKADFSKIKTPLVVILVFLALFAGIYFLGPGLAGLFIAEPGLISYEQNASITAVEDKTEVWDLAEYPELFELRTVQLSGNYSGNGTFKVYLEDEEGQRFLILDNSAIKPENLVSVTGYVIAVNASEEEVGEEEFEISFEAENETEEEGVVRFGEVEGEEVAEEGIIEEINETEEVNITEETEGKEKKEKKAKEEIVGEVNATEEIIEEVNVSEEVNVTEVNITEEEIEKEIKIDLAYEPGTNFDPDNNGIEDIDGAIDFTVSDTEFNWEVDKSKLCTRWQVYPVGSEEATVVCYGNEACCNFVGLEPYMDNWDDSFV